MLDTAFSPANQGNVVPFNAPGNAAGSLIVFEDARREIAEAQTTDQVKRILAMATGLAAAARKATDREMEAEAAVLRLEAERKLGQLIEAQKEAVGLNKGGRPKTGIPENPVSAKPPTLAAAGIDKNLADRARRAAAMPEEAFKAAKEAERNAVRTRSRPRKLSLNAAHYATVLGSQISNPISNLAAALKDEPEKTGLALDLLLDHLPNDPDFIADLTFLFARHPTVGAIMAAVAAKFGGDAGSDREFQIRFIRAQSEITELQARIAELEAKPSSRNSTVQDDWRVAINAFRTLKTRHTPVQVMAVVSPSPLVAEIANFFAQLVKPAGNSEAPRADSVPDDLSIPDLLQREAS